MLSGPATACCSRRRCVASPMPRESASSSAPFAHVSIAGPAPPLHSDFAPPPPAARRPRGGLTSAGNVATPPRPPFMGGVAFSPAPPGPVKPVLLGNLVVAPPLAGAGRPSARRLDATPRETRGIVGLTPRKVAGGEHHWGASCGLAEGGGLRLPFGTASLTSLPGLLGGAGFACFTSGSHSYDTGSRKWEFRGGEGKSYRGTGTVSERRGPRSARGPLLPPFSRRTDSAERP